MRELSKRQQEILSFIRTYMEENGRSPSYAEIAEALSFSIPAAHYAVEALVRKGALGRDGNLARSITLSQAERAERENIPIPLFPAEPMPADLSDAIDTGRWIYERKAVADSSSFAFRVTSESMKDGGILPGDIALMTRDIRQLHNGAIVLADSGESNERMELRRYHRLPSYTLLIPENEIMGERKSMFVTVYGILIAIRRSYELPAARP